jgi:hypothetical protein
MHRTKMDQWEFVGVWNCHAHEDTGFVPALVS